MNRKIQRIIIALFLAAIMVTVGIAAYGADEAGNVLPLGLSETPQAGLFGGETITVEYLDDRSVTAKEIETLTADGSGGFSFTPGDIGGYTYVGVFQGGEDIGHTDPGTAFSGNSSGGTAVTVKYKYIHNETQGATGIYSETFKTKNMFGRFGFESYLRLFPYAKDSDSGEGDLLVVQLSPLNDLTIPAVNGHSIIKNWIPGGQKGQQIIAVEEIIQDANGAEISFWYSTDSACKVYSQTQPDDLSDLTSIEMRMFNCGARPAQPIIGVVVVVEIDPTAAPSGMWDNSDYVATGTGSWNSNHTYNADFGHTDIPNTNTNHKWRAYYVDPKITGEVRFSDTDDEFTADYNTASPASGAMVELLDSGLNILESKATGSDGKYSFNQIASFDDLSVRVSKDGYKSYIIPVDEAGADGSIAEVDEFKAGNVENIDRVFTESDSVFMPKVAWKNTEALTEPEKQEVRNGTDGQILLLKDGPLMYTVTFDPDGGTPAPLPQLLEENDLISEPIITKTGHDFLGWYRGSDKWDFSTDVMPAWDITLTAKWEPIKYTVQFKAYTDGADPATQTVNYNTPATQPAVSKVGHTLEGWYQNSGFTGSKWNFATGVKSDMTLHAKWEPIKYTVQFKAYADGANPATQTVSYNTPATQPPVSKVGHILEGWYQNSGFTGSKWNFSTGVTADMTLHAKWEPIKYTVQFKAYTDGADPATQTVNYNTPATQPPVSKVGHILEGWYQNSGFTGSKWNFSTGVTADMTLHAKWEPIKYTVQFKAYADGANPATQTVSYNTPATQPPVSKVGHILEGWYQNSGFTGSKWNFSTGVTADMTLHAKWEPIKYTVQFKAYATAPDPATQTVNYNTPATQPAVSKVGHTLEGWYENASFTGSKWNFATGVKSDMTLHAKWEPIKYTVQFKAYATAPDPATQTVNYNTPATQPAVSKVGHTLEGWYENSGFTGSKWNFSTGVTADMTLHAKWEPIKYTVQFKAYATAPDPATQTVNYNTPATQPAVSKVGHTLEGWYENASFTGSKWNFATGVKSDMTLHAKWEPIKYTVQFKAYATAPDPATQTVNYNTPATQPAVSKVGHTLEGWYENSGFTGSKWNFSTGVTADMTLHAKWEPIKYTVQFKAYTGGADPADQTIQHGNKATQPPVEKGKYYLEGWYKTDNFAPADKWNFGSGVTSNMTLHANWKPLIKITFDVKGGYPAPAGQLKKPWETIDVPQTPIKIRDGFTGWFKDGLVKWDFSKPVGDTDVHLVAGWLVSNPLPKATPTYSVGSGSSASSSSSSKEQVDLNIAASAAAPTASSGVTKTVTSANVAEIFKAATQSGTSANQLSLKLYNQTSVTKEILAKLASMSSTGGKSLVVHFDNITKGVVTSRITVNPVAVTKDINLKLETKSTPAGIIISTEQKDGFGSQVNIAVKLTDTMKKEGLKLYRYHRDTHTVSLISGGEVQVDSNGYAHFKTLESGDFYIV